MTDYSVLFDGGCGGCGDGSCDAPETEEAPVEGGEPTPEPAGE